MATERVVPVVAEVQLPAGVAGPEPVSFDVRCFLVRHDDGLLLVDTGLAPDGAAVEVALSGVGAEWSDVTDVVLTHAHPDHCGALSTLSDLAPSAVVWGGEGDLFAQPVRPAHHADVIRGLRVVATPGHTAGHLCLFDENQSMLFAGDAVGSQAGGLTQGPEPFIADHSEALRSLQLLTSLRAERILFGHGGEVADPAQSLAAFVEGVARRAG